MRWRSVRFSFFGVLRSDSKSGGERKQTWVCFFFFFFSRIIICNKEMSLTQYVYVYIYIRFKRHLDDITTQTVNFRRCISYFRTFTSVPVDVHRDGLPFLRSSSIRKGYTESYNEKKYVNTNTSQTKYSEWTIILYRVQPGIHPSRLMYEANGINQKKINWYCVGTRNRRRLGLS